MKTYNIVLLFLLFMLSTSTFSQDWANLKRYQDANLIIAKNNSPVDVVFMGDSITEGWEDLQPDFFGDSGYINRGISGQTTPQMLIRFRQDVIDLNPKAVVILAGTNDIAENTGPSTLKMIQDNIASMAEIAAANNIKVVLCSVLPVFDYPWKPGLNPVQKIEKLNTWIKSYSEKQGHIYLDYYPSLINDQKGMKKVYAHDGVHPTTEGYEVMKHLAEKTIKSALY